MTERTYEPPSAGEGAASTGASSAATAHERGSMRARAVRASLWVVVGQFGGYAIQLVSGMVMTRLLHQDSIGLMTVAFTVLTGISLCSELGIRVAVLTHPRGDDPLFLDTAYTIQVLRGGLEFVTCLVAGWACTLYDQPQLVLLVPAIGVTALLEGFTSTRLYTASRNLVFAATTLVPLGAQLAAFVVRVSIALAWPSVWSIVVGALCGSCVTVLSSHFLVAGRRDRLRWERAAARDIWQLGKWIALAMVFVFLGTQADRLLFAGLIPIALVGVYGLSWMLASVPTDFVGRLCSSYGQPALTRAQATSGSIHRALGAMRLPMLAFGGAAGSALVLLAPFITGILFDHRYAASAWITRLLALVSWLRTMDVINCMALMAVGAARLNAISNIIKCVFMVSGFLLGAHLAPEGRQFEGALTGLVVSEVVKYVTGTVQAFWCGISAIRLETVCTLGILVPAGAAWHTLLFGDVGTWLPVTLIVAGAVFWAVCGARAWRSIRGRAPQGKAA